MRQEYLSWYDFCVTVWLLFIDVECCCHLLYCSTGCAVYRCAATDDLQLQRDIALDADLQQHQAELQTNPKYKAMMQFRKKLPSYKVQQVI